MRKLLIASLILTLGFASSAFAITYLTTLQQAAQYCPAPKTGLIYKANPTGARGLVHGIQGGKQFTNVDENGNPYAPKPYYLNGNVIGDGAFRSVTVNHLTYYGYISNSVVNCMYSYTPALSKILAFALTMRSSS